MHSPTIPQFFFFFCIIVGKLIDSISTMLLPTAANVPALQTWQELSTFAICPILARQCRILPFCCSCCHSLALNFFPFHCTSLRPIILKARMYMVLDITKSPNGTITFVARPEIYAFYTIWKSHMDNNWETPPAVLLDII